MKSTVFKPHFFSNEEGNLDQLEDLKKKNPSIKIVDSIESQLMELIKILNPSGPISREAIKRQIQGITKTQNLDEFGNWVYYPWNNTVVHLLPEKEFIQVRTNRNMYKITPEEYHTLQKQSVGVVGLSVGSAIAITMVQERILSEIRLADFDELELSNCNRINTSVCNLGLDKVVITARQIAEIDPYIDVKIYPDGITSENITDFMSSDGGIDLLLDECDEIAVKIKLRIEAKKLKIPVVMDTSDRGLIDVERYEQEPQRPIFHGLLEGMDLSKVDELKTTADKLPYVLPILGIENLSTRGKASMLEIGQTINTWPQLASSIALGAGATVDTCRRILSGKQINSGRYYVDIEQIIPHQPKTDTETVKDNRTPPLAEVDMARIIEKCEPAKSGTKALSDGEIATIVEAGIYAPTSGNDQPWKWVYNKKRLFLFHDIHYSESYGDFLERPSMIGLGAALENVYQAALSLGLVANIDLFPVKENEVLIASVEFSESKHHESIFDADAIELIKKRCTNRTNAGFVEIGSEKLEHIKQVAKQFGLGNLHLISDRDQMQEIGEIIGECDRIRLLNTEAYKDFVDKEIRWTEEELKKTKTGNDFKSLQLSSTDSIAIRLIRDQGVIEHLKEMRLGSGFTKISQSTVESASVLGLITMPDFSKKSFLNGGMLSERIWLKATDLSIELQPLISPIYFFMRLIEGKGAGLSKIEIDKLRDLRERFETIIPALKVRKGELFLFRLNIADDIKHRSVRRPLKEVLSIEK